MLKPFKHKDQMDDPQDPRPKSNYPIAPPVADIRRSWMLQIGHWLEFHKKKVQALQKKNRACLL